MDSAKATSNISATGKHVRETFAQFGLAAYHAQCLELDFKNLLMLNAWVRRTCCTRREMDALLKRNDIKTLGRLLREVKESIRFDTQVDQLLENALKGRNFLTHSFFECHAGDFMFEHGREKMIRVLKQHIAIFEQADAAVKCLTLLLNDVVGVTDAMVDREYGRLMSEAGRR